METTNPETLIVKKPFFSFIKDKKKLLTVFLVLLLVLSTLIFLAYLFGLFKEFAPSSAPSPTPSNEATASAKRVPSSLASDQDFIKLEGDLNNFEQDLNSVDLSESKLNPPIIELSISFGE